MSKPNFKTLHLHDIRLDGDTQPRAELVDSAIKEYADALDAGDKFPPVTVYHDGKSYWLADGFHRWHAHSRLDRTEIMADVHTGSRRDAILHSVGANATHGLRRTNEDKRQVVLTLLQDEEWAQWSDSEIGRKCGVDHKTVGKYRKELESIGEFPRCSTRQTKDGRQYPADRIAPESPSKGADDPEFDEPAELESFDDDDGPENPYEQAGPGRRPDGRDHPDMNRVMKPREFPGGQKPDPNLPDSTPLREVQRLTQQARKQVKELVGTPLGAFLDHQQIDASLKHVFDAAKFAAPHITCPKCKGKGCASCRLQGWLPKPHYERLPEDER